MGKGSRKRVERVGTRGGKRAHRRWTGPKSDPRRDAALEEARQEAAALEARIERDRLHDLERRDLEERQRREREELARLEAIEQRRLEYEIEQALMAERRNRWTLGQARALIRQGYSIEHTHKMTGYPVEDLEGADRIFD